MQISFQAISIEPLLPNIYPWIIKYAQSVCPESIQGVCSRETRKQTQNLERIEERIRQQEQALQRLSAEMQKAGKKQAFEHVHRLSWQVSKAQATLDELLLEWEELAV